MRARPTFGLGGLVATALLTLGVSPASAQSNSTNTTIAYTDSAIHYEGGWTTDDKGAGVAYTADGNANFTINFAGGSLLCFASRRPPTDPYDVAGTYCYVCGPDLRTRTCI